MEFNRNPVAKRTRAQTNKRIDELVEEYYKKKNQDKEQDQRSHLDLVEDKRDQESSKRKDQECNEEGDLRSHPDIEEDKRDQEPSKIATSEESSSSEDDAVMSPSSSEEHTTDDSDYTLHKEDRSMTSVTHSDTQSSSSEQSSSSDKGESPNRDYRPSSLPSKHGRKKQKLPGNSNPGSVSKQKKPESEKSNGPDCVCELNDSSSSSGEGDREDNGAVTKKRGRKKHELPEYSNPGPVSKQKKPEAERSNGPDCVCELNDSSSSSGEGDREDNGAVTKKRGRKKHELPEYSNPGSVSKQKKPEAEKSNGLDCVFSSLGEGDENINGAVTKKLGRKRKLHGTSTPCSVSTHKKHEPEKANGEDHGVDDRNDDPPVTIKGGKSKRHYSKHSKSKAQGSRKGREFINILSETILANGVENLLPNEETSPVESSVESSLPLKFGFAYEYPVPVEKTEEEKEIEALFAGLEMGLIEDEIGTTNAQMEEDDPVDVTIMTPAERCRLGYHVIILSEAVGKVCKYCKTVCEEIHDILPDLIIRTSKKSEWWYASRKKNGSIFDRLDFDEPGYEKQCTVENLTGSVLNLIPAELRRSMYLHQRDGYEFLWKNVGGAVMIEDLKTPLQKGGTGCIISHAPGTGKSFLTVVFLRAFLNVYPNCQPMIVAPQSMLLTWEAQFIHWGVNIPFHNLNDDDSSGLPGDLSTLSNKERRTAARMIKLQSWINGKDRGVLGVSYQLFEKLADDPKDADQKFRKILLEKPGLVVYDEGHTPRNERSLLWNVLTKMETRRRIILSGTPFQNNFDELRNILSLVKPGFDRNLVDQHSWRKDRGRGRGRKGKHSAWDSLTKSMDKNSGFGTEIDPAKIEELKSMLSPIVHVHEGSILQQHLPGLEDTLILLKPTDEQIHLVKKIKALPKKQLKFFNKCRIETLISVHPSIAANDKLFQDDRDRLKKLKHNVDAGVKAKVLIEIIRLSIARSEKVLVFCSYLDPLKYILNLLISYFTWAEGKQVLYMEGKVNMRDRQSMIDHFNNAQDESKVLLASTNACSEGINLVGASRVVLLDVVWNPSRERQAICRAYRLGQKKVVHVYRLIMTGISEMRKYKRQTKKDQLSKMVFSSKEVDDTHKPPEEASSRVSDDMVLDAIVQHPNLRDSFEYILHQPKEAMTIANFAEV